MKKILIILLLLLVASASAHTASVLEEAKEFIQNKIPCGELTDDQLAHIGDYFMEQMHPGETHEAMDEMMGGEDSESLRQAHIAMARSFYCDNSQAIGPGMMNMMMGRTGGSMMNGYGFMGWNMGLWWFLYVAIAAFIFGIVFWWTYTLVNPKKKR
jgi:hypothetical protein